MIRFICALLIFSFPFCAFSQNKIKKDAVYPEHSKLQDSINSIKQNVNDSIRYFSNDTTLKLLPDPLHHLDNVGFKFIVRELNLDFENKGHQTDSVKDAVNTLLQYVENDSIRDMVFYLKDYIETRKTEEALREVKKRIALEKILSYQPDLNQPEELDVDEGWKATALQELYNYVENDPVNQWIREISRDSVLLGVKNYQNDSINFWINNGKQDFKRFWLKKNRRDSIGIWVQNTSDRSIRILVDDDVYQQSVQKSKVRSSRMKIEKKISADQYKLAALQSYNRYSQVWTLGSTFGFSFNQGHVSDSWSGSGESSIATISTISTSANYKKGDSSWDNAFTLKYGLLKSGGDSFQKNEDEIKLTSKYAQKAVKNWYYSALFTLKTQMFKGYDYSDDDGRELISNFFAPAYIIGSVGMDYKPNNNFSILLSPIALKYTIVSDTSVIDQTDYGVDEDKKIKKEIGSYVGVTHSVTFWDDMKLSNELTLYSNYALRPKNVDVDWEMSLEMPVNQYISTKISLYLISDDDTSSKIQFKENVSVGLSYTL
ncbi:DUF3078 domain-containing protein [Labilibaculum sp.]|uniref:DUF3078 domain-containing protein n=1 Tax=Labilibaculum sp. TaxID=2060723 RepID=UPI003567E057